MDITLARVAEYCNFRRYLLKEDNIEKEKVALMSKPIASAGLIL